VWVVIVEGKGVVLWVNLGRSIVTDGDGDALFPNYLRVVEMNRVKRRRPSQWRRRRYHRK